MNGGICCLTLLSPLLLFLAAPVRCAQSQRLDEAAKEEDNGAQGLDFSVKNFFMPFPPPLLWQGAMPLPFLPAQKKRCVPLKAHTCGALISL